MSYPDEIERYLGSDNSFSASDRERLVSRPTLNNVKPSRVQAGPVVDREAQLPVGWVLVIAGIIGLILGWITAPFGIMPV